MQPTHCSSPKAYFCWCADVGYPGYPGQHLPAPAQAAQPWQQPGWAQQAQHAQRAQQSQHAQQAQHVNLYQQHQGVMPEAYQQQQQQQQMMQEMPRQLNAHAQEWKPRWA